jgi:energy-coupling factor transporter ATP-binding protein EcfA2
MSTTATKETSGPGAPVQAPLVALHGVTKRFGPVQALTSVDLEIPSGQVTALVGDNGARKSVLIKTLSGLWPPDEGRFCRREGPSTCTVRGMPSSWASPRSIKTSRCATTWTSFRTCSSAMSCGGTGSWTRGPWNSRRVRHCRTCTPLPSDRSGSRSLHVSRSAAIGRGRQGDDGRAQAGHHGRADGRPGRPADTDGAEPGEAARR